MNTKLEIMLSKVIICLLASCVILMLLHERGLISEVNAVKYGSPLTVVAAVIFVILLIKDFINWMMK